MSDAPPLLALLPRGEAIRTHVYSGVLSRVAQSVPVRLMSVRPNDAVERMLESEFGPVLPLEEAPLGRGALIARELLDTAHNSWLASEAALERSRRRDQEAAASGTVWKRRLKKALSAPLANAPALRSLDALFEQLASRAPATRASRELLEQLDPALVFNTSHVHSRNAESVVIAARQHRIRTATFLFSWDNLTSQGRIVPPYDFYFAWNESIRRDLLRLYPKTDPTAVFVTGTPQFDFHFRPEIRRPRTEFLESIGVDPARRVVMYSTGMPNHMPGEPEIVEQLADGLRSRCGDGVQLVVRLYAKDRSGRFEELRKRRSDIVFPPVAWEPTWLTPLPEDTALWTNLLLHTDVGVNVASTVSLELCMFDRPVVNVAFNPPSVARGVIDYSLYYRFDHYRPVVASGAVALASNPQMLVDQVVDRLDDPRAEATRRRCLLEAMFGPTLDGRSSERLAAALRDCVR